METPVIKAPFVGSDGRPTIEPGAFFLDGDYSLRVNSWNALAGVVVGVRVRMIRATDGELVDSDFLHTPNSNRTKATNDFPLPAGFILNVTVFASTGTPLVGQTFVQVQLTRGLTGATLLLATMLQDYITSVQALAYPGSPIRSSLDTDGVYRVIVGTDQPAGSEINEVVPAGARWRLLGFVATLVTAAGGPNRTPELTFDDGANIYMHAPSPSVIAGGTSGAMALSPGLPYTTTFNPAISAGGLPLDTTLMAGHRIRTSAIALGGDNWGAPVYEVLEKLEAAV